HRRSSAKSARGERQVAKPNREPDTSDGLRQRIQVPPDQRAESETAERQDDIRKYALTPGPTHHSKLPECGDIDAHKGQKSAKIEQFAGVFVGVADVIEDYGAEKAQAADDENVVSRSAASRAQMRENAPRKDVIAPHSE